MPLSMKIQLIDFNMPEEMMRIDSMKPMAKSRLKRFFDFQFPNVLRNSTVAPEKVMDTKPHFQKDGMVQNFIEENNNNNNNEKQSRAISCGHNRYSCFNRNCIDSNSEDERDFFGDSNYSSTASSQLHLQSSIYHFVLFHRAYLTVAVTNL